MELNPSNDTSSSKAKTYANINSEAIPRGRANLPYLDIVEIS